MAIDPAHRRYLLRTFAFMGAYVAMNIAAMTGAFDDASPSGSWGLALAVAIPVAGHMWATMALMNDADEYLRRLTANRFVAAAGLAITLFTAWGFAETYADAPHLPGWLLYGLFWLAFGVVSPFVRSSR